MSQPVLPQPDRDSSLWWEALDKRELQVQQCDTCGRLRWPARALCNVCHHVDATWVPVSGRGRVVSWTVNHRAAPGSQSRMSSYSSGSTNKATSISRDSSTVPPTALA